MYLEEIIENVQMESDKLECKAKLNRDDIVGWIKTIAGFANASSGDFYIGVEDKTNKLIGFDRAEADNERNYFNKDDPELAIVKAAKAKADEIKGSAYALGKAPEHLTEKQQLRVSLIASQNPRLYRAYLLKEQLRLLLKLTNAEEAKSELKRWLWKASHSRIPAFKELYQKIRRHKTHILNTIRYGMSNAKIEATNNKIKLIIRKAYGFRNIQNMLDMVYLVCSDIRIPLPNRKLNAA